MSLGFVNTFVWLLVVTVVMHEADDAYSIWSTWSCYWLDQFLTLALNTWISSKFSTLYWICLLFIFLILVGVGLPLCIVVTLSWNANLFSGVKLSIRSFFLFIGAKNPNPVTASGQCRLKRVFAWLQGTSDITNPLSKVEPEDNFHFMLRCNIMKPEWDKFWEELLSFVEVNCRQECDVLTHF